MRKSSSLPAGSFLLWFLIVTGLLAAAQPEAGSADPALDPAFDSLQQGTVKLHGRIRNWQLGEGYYVVLAVPEVRSRMQAVFPDRFDAGRVAADGSFDLLLQHEPRLAAGQDSTEPCPGGQLAAGTSFHYLAVTQEPQSGRLFSDFGLVRPVTADPELLVFFTYLPTRTDGAPDAACPLSKGWNVVRFRPDVGLIDAYRSQPPGVNWLLVR